MVHHRRRLLLSYEEGYAEAVVSASIAITHSWNKDPAGHAFHHVALKQAGLLEDEPEVEPDSASSTGPSRESSAADFSSMPGAGGAGEEEDGGKWRGKGKRRKSKKEEGLDLYALLGLQHERYLASQDQIRKAYRAAALEHHPDKQRAAAAGDEEVMAASEDRFKAIQEAYETLMDPVRRREFDSMDAFDDSLPNEMDGATPEGFFKAFGTAFRRNSKWSVNTPVPELGDDEATAEQADAFYEFWFSFKSWREFPHPDEEDLDQAEGREHRRYIERFNAKLREKGKKDEVRRLRNFVELAHGLDPRLKRRREEQKAERERRKAEKAAEREAAAEAERQREEAAARQRVVDEAAAVEAKKQRQVEKKALQKERSKFRKLCASEIVADDDEVELLCSSLDLPTLSTLCAQLADAALAASDKVAALAAQLEELRLDQRTEAERKEAGARATAEAIRRAAEEEAAGRTARLQQWSQEEVRLLRKALDKFPPGTAKRWETVQAYVRTRTTEEIVDMVKHGLKSGKYDPQNDAGGPQILRKRQGNLVIRSDATTRDTAFSDVDVHLKTQQAAEAAPQGNGHAAAPAPAAAAAAAPVAAPARAAGEWSDVEELALVKALKEVPKDAADRWDRVAAAVGTKTKVQCGRRFKEMKESFKARKANG